VSETHIAAFLVGVVVVGSFIMLFIMFFVILLSPNSGTDWRQEAIKRGHAYWHTNEDGSTEFRWKETTK
jgi:hypothetical protein